jgi:hypothetical protein
MSTTEIKDRLSALEEVIHNGQRTFVEVGFALAEIRNNKLYRETHDTFEAYCKERWGWTRGRAYQLMDSAEICLGLPSEMSTVVDSERKARELSRVKPEHREEVVKAAQVEAKSKDRKVTAEDIKGASENLFPRSESGVKSGLEPEKPPMEDYSDQGQKRDLDLACIKTNIEATVTNVIHYAPKGEMSAFKLFLEREAARVGMVVRQYQAEAKNKES